jgi:hypothetical protein
MNGLFWESIQMTLPDLAQIEGWSSLQEPCEYGVVPVIQTSRIFLIFSLVVSENDVD